jgi:hypothetical protein
MRSEDRVRPHPWIIVVLGAAGLGIVLAGLSTYDFVQHLDRQVHSVHCSFIPGLGKAAGESGCQVAMMSPYSSMFRSSVWGGIPIARRRWRCSRSSRSTASTARHAPQDDARDRVPAARDSVAGSHLIVMLIISLSKLGTAWLCVDLHRERISRRGDRGLAIGGGGRATSEPIAMQRAQAVRIRIGERPAWTTAASPS